MSLPSHIDKINQRILEAVRQHPHHQSSAHLRKELYDALALEPEPFCNYLRARLVLITAGEVLPRFRHSLQVQMEADEDFQEDLEAVQGVPAALLQATERLVFHDGEAADIDPLRKQIYNAVLVQYGALYAMLAAYKASYEASRDYDFIKNFLFPHQEIHDADYGKMILGDTAAAAAMAAACAPDRYEFDEGKLLQFWEWWHEQAVPSAWKLAHDDAFSSG